MGKERGFDIGRPTCYAALSSSDMIIWGDSNNYVIHILNPDGELGMLIAKEFDPLNITSVEENEYKQEYADPLKAGMTISFRGKWPAFSGVFIDDEGRVFVRTYERASGAKGSFYYDVFNKDGIFESKVVMPVTLDKNSVWKNGRIYTVEKDENGLPLIKRHRVTWAKEARR